MTLTRVYNIAVIATAQYISCIYFFTHSAPDFSPLTDWHFFILVVCTWLIVGAGYIINFFYDKEKDLLNYPRKSLLNSSIRQNTTLKIYLTLNFLAVMISYLVSLRSVFFFSGYAFFIWLYCHKLKNIPLVSNISMALLSITPIFAVFFYRKVLEIDIVAAHGIFVFLVLLSLWLLNDLKNQWGDAVIGIKTFPLVYGEKNAVRLSSGALLMTVISAILVSVIEKENAFSIYFIFTACVILVCGAILFFCEKKWRYTVIFNTLKVLILIGILSIPLREIFF
ncbi:MAG: UbiA family prenyltransferase [Flavobacteriales bacterium]|nr:UbiA family prenyltransferase [Flavobacteriales bacterium]